MNQVLLQTAYASISDTDLKNSQKSFILFDSGAQRSYITESLKSQLNLQVIRTEHRVIKVFGNPDAELKNVYVVNLKVSGLKEQIFVEPLVIPEIWNSLTNQCRKTVIQENYPHLQGLRFADFSNFETKRIELLIGLEHYYNFVSGNVKKGKFNKLIAIESKLGWILSGRYEKINNRNINLNQTHFFFTVQSSKTFETINIAKSFKNLWNVGSAGTDKEDDDVHKNFEAELTFSDKRYSTKLPFEFYDEVIPDNFSTAKNRLNLLQRKFEKDPSLFETYSDIIENYKSQGIIEEVKDCGKLGNVHYLPPSTCRAKRKRYYKTKNRI